MIALIILSVILIIFVAILFLPISFIIDFKEAFRFKVKFAGICVFKSGKSKNKKTKKEDKPDKNKDSENKSNLFKGLFQKLREKYGLLGAIKKVLNLCNRILSHIKRLLRHIKVKRVVLNLTVVGEDAAATAIEYGVICSAVYPVLAFLDSCAKVDFKSINVNSGFEEKESSFDFSLTASSKVIYLLMALIGAFKEYKIFIDEEEKNERE